MTIETNIGKITGTKETLNVISCAFDRAADMWREAGRNALSSHYREVGDCIYNALNDAGYYE